MIRRPPRSTQSRSSAASDVYKRQISNKLTYTSAVSDTRHVVINDSSDAIVVQDTSDLHVIHTSSASNQQVLSQEMAHGGTVNDHCLLYTSDAADDLLCVDL